jgi:hypothetical protein
MVSLFDSIRADIISASGFMAGIQLQRLWRDVVVRRIPSSPVEGKELLELPKLVVEKRMLQMTPVERQYYDQTLDVRHPEGLLPFCLLIHGHRKQVVCSKEMYSYAAAQSTPFCVRVRGAELDDPPTKFLFSRGRATEGAR